MRRIIDKKGNFLRDDFTFDERTEFGLAVEPAQGFYKPKWDGEKWVEGGEIPEPEPQPPSDIDRLAALEDAVMMITLMSL